MKSSDKNKNLLARLTSRVCGLTAAGFGLLALFGWASGIPVLATLAAGKIMMPPTTAISFILLGFALIISAVPNLNRIWMGIVITVASVTALGGLLLFILSSFGMNLKAAYLGLRIPEGIYGAPIGRLSPLTSFFFILAGASLLFMLLPERKQRWRKSLAILSGYIVLLICMIIAIIYLLGDKFLYGTGFVPPAFSTSIAFLAIGTGLIVNSYQRLRQEDVNSGVAGKNSIYTLIMIFILFSTGIITTGYLYFIKYESNYRTAIEQQLSAIADQKESEIIQWRKERLGDGSVFYNNVNFSGLVKRYLENSNDTDAAERLEIWLEKVRSAYNYDRVFLLDTNSKLLASVPKEDKDVGPHLVRDASEAIATKEIVFLDFHQDATDAPIHLAVIVPVIDGHDEEAPLGVLVLRINPATYLYPLIQHWPTGSKTAETLLVRRDGDEIVFLNELRFKKDSALKLRFPLSQLDLPAVQAALGKKGIVEGIDYRGEPVIAAVRALSETPWFMVAIMDETEVFSPLRERMWMMISFVAVLLIGTATIVGIIWRQQRLLLFKEQYKALEAARAAEIRYRDTLDNMMEGCQIIGFDWKYLYLNDEAVKQSKQTRESLIGHAMMEAYPGIESTEMFADLKHCMSERVAKMIENEFLYPDGEKRYFNLNIQPMHEGLFILSMDITEQKQAEEEIKSAKAFLDIVIDRSPFSMWISDKKGTVIRVNSSLCNTIKLKREEIVGRYNVLKDANLEIQGVMPLVKAVFEKREPARFSIPWKAADAGDVDFKGARDMHIDVSMFPILNAQGRLTNVVCQWVDITERVKAENALRGVFESAMDGILVADVKTQKFVVTNEGMCRMLGYNREELLNLSMEEIHPKEDLTRVAEVFERQARGEITLGSDMPVKRKDGSVFFADINTSPVELGGRACVVGVFRDITNRKLAEEREKNLNGILKAIRGVNQLITRERNTEQLIIQTCSLLTGARGISSAWIILLDQEGKPKTIAKSGSGHALIEIETIVKQGDLPRCANLALAESGLVTIRDFNIECEGCRATLDAVRNGNYTFCKRLEQNRNIFGILSISVPQPFAEDPQEKSLFTEIADDIAFALYNIEVEEEQIRMEKELLESETRYRTIFESAAEGIFLTEVETRRLKYANPAFCQILGYSEDEIILLKVDDLHPEEEIKQINAEFDAHYRTGQPLKQENIIFLKKDRTPFYADVVTTPKISINGTSYSATFILDITERKKAQDEKKKLQEQLFQSQKMEAIGRLSGGIAHDFNNMLTTIIGNSEIALMKIQNDDSLKEIIEDMKSAGEKAAMLTRQLLAFSRRQVLQTEIFSLNEIVKELDKMLKRLIGEDIKLETKLSRDLGLVETDPGQIEQIIMNLAVNARDAMPHGGKLTIETAHAELSEEYSESHYPVIPGDYVMLSLSDTGIGMSKETQEQIFEPFFTTKAKGKGTGLGLSIVYGIVKQSNGYIWVYSEPGKGATFKVYFPRIKNGDVSVKPKPLLEIKCGSETILVVEDDTMIIKMTRKTLESCGYRVLCAADGREALRVSSEYKDHIHLMLTDVIMPNMGGKETATKLKETRPDLKVLYMSGYTDNAIVHHGVLEKGLSFIQKPFTPNGLLKKIREVLEQ